MVEKYIRQILGYGCRGYFYFKDNGVTTSEYLNIRRYFNDVNSIYFN